MSEYPDFHSDAPLHQVSKKEKTQCKCGTICHCDKNCDCESCGCLVCSPVQKCGCEWNQCICYTR